MKIPVARIEKFVVPEKDAQGSPLAHLWLDVEGKRLLVTDGHKASRITIEVHENDVSGLIPIEAFELARKELKAIQKINKDEIPDPWLEVIANEDSVFIQNLLTTTTHLVKRPKLETDKKYPSVDAVFPALTTAPTITLNGEQLAVILAGIGMEGFSVSLWIENQEKCVTIAADFGDTLTVLMPMRGGELDVAKVSKRGAPAVLIAIAANAGEIS